MMTRRGKVLTVLALAACTASVRAADDTLQAQLAAIEAAQMAAARLL